MKKIIASVLIIMALATTLTVYADGGINITERRKKEVTKYLQYNFHPLWYGDTFDFQKYLEYCIYINIYKDIPVAYVGDCFTPIEMYDDKYINKLRKGLFFKILILSDKMKRGQQSIIKLIPIIYYR